MYFNGGSVDSSMRTPNVYPEFGSTQWKDDKVQISKDDDQGWTKAHQSNGFSAPEGKPIFSN